MSGIFYKLCYCTVYQSAIPLEKVRRTNLQMVHLGENYGCFVSTYVSTYLPVEKIPQKTHKHCLIFPLFLPQLLNKIHPTVIFIYHTLRFTQKLRSTMNGSQIWEWKSIMHYYGNSTKNISRYLLFRIFLIMICKLYLTILSETETSMYQ